MKSGVTSLGNFRLLLGAEPESGEQLGLRAKPEVVLPARRSYGGGAKGLLRGDLERLQFSEATLRLVEDLIAFLRRDSVRVRLYENGFLHAKCYLFYADRPGAAGALDRFCPILAIVGSSNFTGPAFATNRELNLVHTAVLDPGQVDDPRAREAVRNLYEQLEQDSDVGADGVRPGAHAVCPYIAPDELEAAPRSVDPVQQTLATAIQNYLNHPDVDRNQAKQALSFLNQPMLAVQVKELRRLLRQFQAASDVKILLDA
ncbi:MAG TPA: phospholipase D-like domain-containing protein, partial [Planctomycetota bacterium]|nr:phospholipase D-like domain-containing protein [Planctomycetota bacterium]